MESLLYYSPVIIVVVVFLVQQRIVVTPEQLERKHREILSDIENRFVSIHSYEDLKSQFSEIKDKIDNNMLSLNTQVNLFDEENKQIKPYIIKKELDRIFGVYLFCVGKVLAVENNGIIELIDTKKMEGYLFEFKNIKIKYR